MNQEINVTFVGSPENGYYFHTRQELTVPTFISMRYDTLEEAATAFARWAQQGI